MPTRRAVLALLAAVVAGGPLGGRTRRRRRPRTGRSRADRRRTGRSRTRRPRTCSTRAVLDRLEPGPGGEQLAVLVLDRQDGTEGLVVPAGRLPARARHPDAVLAVALRDGDLVAARYLPRATARRTTRAQSRLDRLARDGGAEEAGADSPVGEPDGTGDDG